MKITVNKLVIGLSVLCISPFVHLSFAQPADGWKELEYAIQIQSPYDLPPSDRYSFADSVHQFWVYSTDKPHTKVSKTKARSELRILGADYTSEGRHRFEGDFFIPKGTSGTSIMQIFGGGGGHATSFMLRIYQDTLKRYTEETLMTGVYDRWIHLNVIHNAASGEIKVFLNGSLAITCQEFGKDHHYFKCGVYNQNDPSDRNECRWKNIRVWESE